MAIIYVRATASKGCPKTPSRVSRNMMFLEKTQLEIQGSRMKTSTKDQTIHKA